MQTDAQILAARRTDGYDPPVSRGHAGLRGESRHLHQIKTSRREGSRAFSLEAEAGELQPAQCRLSASDCS